MYDNCRIFGPYITNEGRRIVHIISPNGNRKCIQYAKYLLEVAMGRHLLKTEEVHHIDGDSTNDSLNNLEPINRIKHRQQHSRIYYGEWVTCVWCGSKFWLSPKQQSSRTGNRKRNKLGPFCSRYCSDKYGQQLQSAQKETSEVELHKVGEALPIGNPEPSLNSEEGVETRREEPKSKDMVKG